MKRALKLSIPIYFILIVVFWASGEEKPFRPRDYTAHLVGHAHIDLSWLWVWEETVHDIATNTFAGTLERMDRMPGLTFAQSQAAIYEAIEKEYPPLFERIRQKVKQETWAPVGGMWVEPDLNMPSGESLARQLLYGKRYFLDKFGVDVKAGWNPDSFGHSWQLPQLLRKSGISSYTFERCAPDKTHVFWWEGMDGSRVLAYVPPGWYLVGLRDGVQKLIAEAAAVAPVKDFLILYGEGDHGGGPRDSDLDAIRRVKNDKSQPKMAFAVPEIYFRNLEAQKTDFPVVGRELNFTFPACYTTQVETKKNNRKSENLLFAAEAFSALASASGYRDYYPERDLDEAWKIVLRNQFHDILDGSSIGPVYDEVKNFYKEVYFRGGRALDFSLEAIANAINTEGEGIPLVVFNPLFWERTDAVETTVSVPSAEAAASLKILDPQGGQVPYQIVDAQDKGKYKAFKVVFVAERVPSFGYKLYRVIPASETPSFASTLAVSENLLENESLKLALDPQTGRIKSLFDKAGEREMLAADGNMLQAIVDEPESMSAWELGLKDTYWNIGDEGARVAILEKGPVRGVIRVQNAFRNSIFEQDVILYAGIPRIDCRMNLDWQERNLMVKVAFPANVKNGEVACEIPFGAILRAADGTEVPALRWVDAADDSGDYGLSLLNDSRYGFDVKNNMMRMSIIHGAVSPDPEADRGSHELLYSLYPHRGTWKEAGTLRRASEINNPLLARQVMAHKGQLSAAHSFIQAEPDNVVVSCLKKEMGYYGRGVILRLYEAFGKPAEIKIQFPWPVEAQETDLIERPLKKLDSRGKTLSLSLNPYEIKTLRISKSGQ